MSDTLIPSDANVSEQNVQKTGLRIFAGRRGRKLREYILAYALLLPAFIIIFTFGIFPLAFSAYESTLTGLNKIVGTYVGLGNYVKAIDNLTYVVFFWLAIAFFYIGIQNIVKVRSVAAEHQERPWLWAIPATILSVGMLLFVRFFFMFLPELLGVADKMRKAQRAGEGPPSLLFRQFVSEAFHLPNIQQAFWLSIAVLAIAIVAAIVFVRILPKSRHQGEYYGLFVQISIMLIGATALAWYTWSEVQRAYADAIANGESLDIWTQVITISAGFVLLLLSWWLWNGASRRDSNFSMVWRLGAAVVLMIGGYLLIVELPQVIGAGDKKWWMGLQNTVYYSLGTIPFQLAISLMLATFLFQDIRGKSFFRVIYFLPYITPVVGAAAIFRILFSGRVDAPVNRIVTAFGFEALGWLNEPNGIFQMMLGQSVRLPAWAVGPSLSMIVIIIFSIWTFVGFNTVIFLAGLGSIPSTLYESASIDGAGRWAQFRHITLPLLSPTIYLLTLYAVIGTFKAFTHIFVLRTGAALGTTDTASVVIFDAFNRDTRIGYASALAMLLLLIVMGLTVINNRVASKKVFYG
ncbi:MAG: sugar ABC transporter permease [Ardenticatenaceae bacterium]|nr:sugar ABC transporter permease [Ardenticatenaceae bacterium]